MKTIETLTIKSLLEKEFPPSESILGADLLDKSGAMLITGPQKVGKSLFACQLALSVADRQVPIRQVEVRYADG